MAPATVQSAWRVCGMNLEARSLSGYERSVIARAARVKTASPVIHTTRKGASIGFEPTAARTNMTRLKAARAAAAITPRRCRRTTNICSSPMPSSHGSLTARSPQVAQALADVRRPPFYVSRTSFADTNSRIVKTAASRTKRTTTPEIHPPSTSNSWKQNPA